MNQVNSDIFAVNMNLDKVYNKFLDFKKTSSNNVFQGPPMPPSYNSTWTNLTWSEFVGPIQQPIFTWFYDSFTWTRITINGHWTLNDVWCWVKCWSEKDIDINRPCVSWIDGTDSNWDYYVCQ